MSLLNRDVLTSKLKSLDATQQSIEKITSWVLFYTREARTVVQVWLEELIRLPPDKKLAHLYLANHILQEGRKKGREWGDEFARVMQQAIKDISRTTNDKVRSSVARTIKVWEERRVFTSALIKVLRDTLEAAKPSSGAGSGSSAGELDPASQRKLQAIGVLGDLLADVSATAEKSAHYNAKIMQLKPRVSQEGSAQEVEAARSVLGTYIAALQAEAAARQKAAAELHAQAAKQEDATRRLTEQVKVLEEQQAALDVRSQALAAEAAQQQQQQQQHGGGGAPGQPGQGPVPDMGGMQGQGSLPNPSAMMDPMAAMAGLMGALPPLLPPDVMMAAIQQGLARGLPPDAAIAAFAAGTLLPPGSTPMQPPMGPMGGMPGGPPQHQPAMQMMHGGPPGGQRQPAMMGGPHASPAQQQQGFPMQMHQQGGQQLPPHMSGPTHQHPHQPGMHPNGGPGPGGNLAMQPQQPQQPQQPPMQGQPPPGGPPGAAGGPPQLPPEAAALLAEALRNLPEAQRMQVAMSLPQNAQQQPAPQQQPGMDPGPQPGHVPDLQQAGPPSLAGVPSQGINGMSDSIAEGSGADEFLRDPDFERVFMQDEHAMLGASLEQGPNIQGSPQPPSFAVAGGIEEEYDPELA